MHVQGHACICGVCATSLTLVLLASAAATDASVKTGAVDGPSLAMSTCLCLRAASPAEREDAVVAESGLGRHLTQLKQWPWCAVTYRKHHNGDCDIIPVGALQVFLPPFPPA